MGWGQSNTAELTGGTMPACRFCPEKEREGKLPHREERLKLFQSLSEKSLLIVNMCS